MNKIWCCLLIPQEYKVSIKLVLQGSVPVGDSKPDELQIFKVYICIEGSCWSRSRSCKVFRNCWRNIVPVANSHLDSTVPSLPLEGTKKQQHKDSAFGDVFGSGFTDLAFNSVNKEEEKEQTSDFSDLITALDSLNTHDPNIDPTVKQRKLSSRTNEKRITESPTQDAFDSTSLRILKQNSGGKILPSFEVNVAHASRSDRRLSRESHLDQHAQELANQFHEDAIHMQYDSVEPIQGLLEEAQASSETSQRRVEASKHHTKVKPEALCGTTMLASWEGEAYEEDKVLVLTGRPAIKNSFLKFMKHISLNPEQCIRFNSCYSSVSVLSCAKSASVLLWPESKVPCPKLCSYCKSPREFAFQIMGPSISALEETYEWSKYNVNNLEDMVIPPVSWDWISLAVFGCKIGCHGRDNTDHSSSWDTWLEEEIFVAQE